MRRVFILLICLFALTVFIVHSKWNVFDDTPPILFSLKDNPTYYHLTKSTDVSAPYYSLVYEPPNAISRAATIGSSTRSLDDYIGKQIKFSAEWRKSYGAALCFTTPCPKLDHIPVIDIRDIQLVSP